MPPTFANSRLPVNIRMGRVRPAVSEKRLSLTEHGQVRYSLKTPWRDGTTHVIFEPLDFIARLAALMPKSRVNLTRYGVRPAINLTLSAD